MKKLVIVLLALAVSVGVKAEQIVYNLPKDKDFLLIQICDNCKHTMRETEVYYEVTLRELPEKLVNADYYATKTFCMECIEKLNFAILKKVYKYDINFKQERYIFIKP